MSKFTTKPAKMKVSPNAVKFDKFKTAKQNYAQLGIVQKLNISPKELRNQRIAFLQSLPAKKLHFRRDDTLSDSTAKKRRNQKKRKRQEDEIDQDIEDPTAFIDEETRLPIQDINIQHQIEIDIEKTEFEKSKNKRPICTEAKDICRILMQKYGEDYDAMSRDIKINKLQHTAGHLQRMCKETLEADGKKEEQN